MRSTTKWLAALALLIPARLLATCGPAVDAAVGADAALVLRDDGTVWSFGTRRPVHGPYSDGGAEAVLVPLPVRATAGAAGDIGAALGDDGSVWTWTGDTPERVAGIPPMAFIGVHRAALLGIEASGQAWLIVPSGTPAPEVIGSFVTPQPLVAVAVRYRELTGLDAAGTVWRLRHFPPDCTSPAAPLPAGAAEAVTGIPAIVAVGSAHETTVALDVNGDTWIWGCFGNGLALDPALATSDVPVRSASAPGATSVAVRHDAVFAVDPASGTALSWGNGWTTGEGTGRDAPASAPVRLAVADVRRVASGPGHGLAIDGSGRLWAWGLNIDGDRFARLPDVVTQPAEVPGLSNVVDVAAGLWHVVAVTADGRAWGWGGGWSGQLGTAPGQELANRPMQVAGSGYSACAAGGSVTAFLKPDGSAWSCGYGMGAAADAVAWEPVPAAGLSNVIEVAAGDEHVLALRGDGTVWGWGDNSVNQLGLGAGIAWQGAPAQVPGLDRVVVISAREDSSSALRADGSVWFWGDGEGNRMGGWFGSGIGPTMTVPGPFIAHSQGGWHSLALDASGAITAWGWYTEAALGVIDPPLDACGLTSPPVAVPEPVGPERIDAGYNDSYAIMPDGTTWAWGWNEEGFAAPDLPVDRVWTPRVMAGMPPLAEVSSGWTVTAARTRDGRVLTWGEDDWGQLGQGRPIATLVPIEVDPGDALDGMGPSLRLNRVPGGTLATWGSRFGTSAHRLYRASRPDMSGETVIVETAGFSWLDTDTPSPVFYYRVAGLDCAGAEGP